MSQPLLPHLGKYLRDRYERLDQEKDSMVSERLDKLSGVTNLPTAGTSWWRTAKRGVQSSLRRLADRAALLDVEIEHAPSTFAASKAGGQAGAAAAHAAREAGLVSLSRLIGERGAEATFGLLGVGLPPLGGLVARKTVLPAMEEWSKSRAKTLTENNRRLTGLGTTTFDIDAARAARGQIDKLSAGWGESLSNSFDNALTSYAPSSVVSGVNSVRKSLGFQPALSNEARSAQASRAAAPAPATPAQAAAPKPAMPAPSFQAPKPASAPAMPKTTGAAPAATPAPAAPKAPAFGKKPGQK